MQHYGHGRTVEDAVADLFRPQTRKAMSECDRLWVRMMQHRDAIDIAERYVRDVQRNLERARRDLRSKIVDAATNAVVAIGVALTAAGRILNALRVLRQALNGGPFSRNDLARVFLALSGITAAVNAVNSAVQALNAYDDTREFSSDLDAAAKAADDARRRVGVLATRIERECGTMRHVG